MITFQNVDIKFGEFHAVKTLICIFMRGILHVSGPSGCGKTTTLRSLVGFIMPTSGQIPLKDADITRLPIEKERSMVFQSYALFPTMNVYENIAFGLRVKKLPKAELIRRFGTLPGRLI